MHIAVLIKQIFDPEVATTVFRIDEEAREIVPLPGVSPVVSPFDEQAVEAALRIKDELGGEDGSGIKVTVITMADDSARVGIKGELAKGADEGVLLSDPAFEGADAVSTARTLAAAIQKLGDVDIVLAGRQAADGDLGVVGLGVAELLDIPAITFACDVRVDGETLRVVRVLEDGTETVEAGLPALVTISHELGKPRYAGLRETMRAARKPIHAWSAADLEVDAEAIGAAGSRKALDGLYIPDRTIDCEMIEGETPEEIAATLASRLKEADLL
ncbi:MAG: electron transfer flavoprotein subunit beta [Rhodospirillaceae bacterium]|nr:electron transfer flavoprotein subunit beta [Rhodospirillaceae bacterium]